MKLNHPRDPLVGVIDIKQGQAVHAVAGKREQYQPITFCKGDPMQLALYYLGLGMHRIYVADLDAIAGDSRQPFNVERFVEAVETCAEPHSPRTRIEWTIDAGRMMERTDLRHRLCLPNVSWVAATEWMDSPRDLDVFCERFESQHVVLGLDFHDGTLLGCQPEVTAWLTRSAQCGIGSTIVLDLMRVGTANGPTTGSICQKIRREFPDIVLYSGGGIRNDQDIESLTCDGCNRFLVATSAHPSINPPPRPSL